MSATVIEPSAERLFSHFLDAVDGTACFPASSTPAEIAAACSPIGLRFPLLLDPSVSIFEHVTASTHAPASCRFGPYCDNILGMNWRCPNGSLVRIGEQVAKTTTGYDWLRFLLHSGTRFGSPVDYVVRLRPECGQTQAAILEGSPEDLKHCLREFIHSGWMHWWDAVDFLAESDRFRLRVIYHAVPDEMPIYAHRISEVATGRNVEVTSGALAECARDGIPDLVLKTTPDRTVALAQQLAREGHRCVALWYSGVVHAYFKDEKDMAARATAIGTDLAPQLEADGGDWHSKHLPAAPPRPDDREWLKVLQEVLDTL